MRKEMKICTGEKKMRKKKMRGRGILFYYENQYITFTVFFPCFCKLPYLTFNPFSL